MNHSFPIASGRIALMFGLCLITGCLGHYHKIPPSETKATHRGVASWYGPSFHGKTTANGESYDMWALTAAHKTLPFGTWVQVKKVDSGKTVTVRINDRGPFIKGRIIDLSYAAARELRMIGEGTAEVTLTIHAQSRASLSAKAPFKTFWVQAGAFTLLTEAMTLREQLSPEYPHVQVKTVALPSGKWHRVQIGAFDSRKAAQMVAKKLKNDWGVDATLSISN